MAVDLQDVPSEGAPLVDDGFCDEDILNEGVVLNPVRVHDRRQVVQLVVGGEERGLPDLAFIKLPIT